MQAFLLSGGMGEGFLRTRELLVPRKSVKTSCNFTVVPSLRI